MDEPSSADWYVSRRDEILALYDDHAGAWRPSLAVRYGPVAAEEIIAAARAHEELIVPTLSYIGGETNPMTRHLIRSTTSLALHLAMRDRGTAAGETGLILYEAVRARVRTLLPEPDAGPTPAQRQAKREEARRSQMRRYPGDWVWEYIEGAPGTGDYGYDFVQCGTQLLYARFAAEAFLPYTCYLDLITFRRTGWGLLRTGTLAEGFDRCDFRFVRGARSECGWPPPFAR